MLRSPQALVRAYNGLLRVPPAARRAEQTPRRQADMRPAAPGREAGSGGNKQEPPAKTGQKQAPTALPETLRGEERRIAELVQQGVSTPEELIERCGLPAPRVMALVTMLEVDGVLRREKGRLVMGGR